jgi:hypothetical protein
MPAPSKWEREMPEETKYFAAATGRSDHLPHELSIWRKAPSQKVLNVTWDDAGKIELIDVLAKELTDWVNAHPFSVEPIRSFPSQPCCPIWIIDK